MAQEGHEGQVPVHLSISNDSADRLCGFCHTRGKKYM